MTVIAQTARLRLRTWQHGDQAKLERHCNTVRVMEHLGGVQSRRLLRDDVRWFKQCWSKNGHSYWVLERQEDDEFLGFCGLDLLTRDVAPNLAGEVEIGWRLREDAWGRDYATESASVVLDLAFCIRRIERVVSRADVANQASINVMQKLGMRQWHARETDVEEVVYVIQRSDWVGSRSRKGGVLEHASD